MNRVFLAAIAGGTFVCGLASCAQDDCGLLESALVADGLSQKVWSVCGTALPTETNGLDDLMRRITIVDANREQRLILLRARYLLPFVIEGGIPRGHRDAFSLFVVQYDGALRAEIDLPISNARSPRLSPDGKRILVTGGEFTSVGNRHGVFISEIETAHWRLVHAVDAIAVKTLAAAWLGVDSIAVARSGEILVVPQRGGAEKSLFAGDAPSSSPNGTLLFARSPLGEFRLFRSGTMKPMCESLTTKRVLPSVAWSDDSNHLWFADDDGSRSFGSARAELLDVKTCRIVASHRALAGSGVNGYQWLGREELRGIRAFDRRRQEQAVPQ